MLSVKINKILDGMRLPKKDRAEVNRLIARPEVQAVLMADEQEQLTHRKALLKELATIPGKIEKDRAAFNKEFAPIAERFKQVEAEYRALLPVYTAMTTQGSFVGYDKSISEKTLKDELISGSDPRISEYYFHVWSLEGRIRSKIEHMQSSKKNWTGEIVPIYWSNADDVGLARNEVNKALATLDALQLKAITSAEVTQALKEITNALIDPLGALDMFPPTIDENGRVIKPYLDGASIKIEQVA